MSTQRTFCLSRRAQALCYGVVALVVFFLVNLYVANQGHGTIEKSGTNGVRTVFASSGSNKADGLAFGGSSNFYLANQTFNTIERFDSSGTGSAFANSGSNQPKFIAVQIPEPGTWAMLALGIGAVLGGLRLRRRSC